MKRLLFVVLVLAMLVLALPVLAEGGGEANGCPKGDDWYLESLIFVIENFDQGNYKDQNGDGLVCIRIPHGFGQNQGQGGGTGAEAGSWVVKDNTN